MLRGGAVIGLVLAALAGPAPALAGFEQWDGSNPFNCELQQAGFGALGPQPEVDPYCVEFDKTRQNVSQLGIVDFLAQEPARVAAAAPKCFYYQVDHWRGSVVQDDDRTELYEWHGRYFFDKARGEGGVHIVELGGGGRVVWTDSFHVHPDPRCAEAAERDPGSVYADPR